MTLRVPSQRVSIIVAYFVIDSVRKLLDIHSYFDCQGDKVFPKVSNVYYEDLELYSEDFNAEGDSKHFRNVEKFSTFGHVVISKIQ
jgi:hypothetical protein